MLGGNFAQVDGFARNRLAAINANGVVLLWNPSASHAVHALKISGGTIYVGGQFTQVSGAPRNRLAAIDVHGVLLP